MATRTIRKSDVPTPDEIIKMVDNHEEQTEPLRARMERDYDLLTLLDVPDPDGYRTYVSSQPLTYLEKLVSWLVNSKLIIRFAYGKSPRVEREQLDAAERFLYGVFHQADERLERMLLLPMRDQLAWYICARGMHAGRAVLVKDEDDGETYVDITPWDPLHVYWGLGKNGLAWVCHRAMKTPEEIEAEYGLVIEGNQQEGLNVYDWYDDTFNTVVVDNEWAKEPLPHGHHRVPAHLGFVGPTPLVRRRTANSLDTIADYGESIFKANREIYETFNFTMATMKYLVGLTRKRAFTLTSADGSKTLDDNPFQEGTEVPLSERDKIELLPLLEMSKDTGAFLQIVSSELQRGSLPYTAYGELAFALSGYAIKLLSQAIDMPLAPRLKAMRQAYSQISMLLLDQYVLGNYEPMQLAGRGNNRRWFDERIVPEQLIAVGVPEIRLIPDIPQDEMAKLQMAQLAREGQPPLLPDIAIWDDILELEDADLVSDQIKEQLAERFLPPALLTTLRDAAIRRENWELATLYQMELAKLAGQPGPLTGGPNGAGPGAGASAGRGQPNPPRPGSNPGYSPQTLPNAAQGKGPPQPTPQAGPNVPPGTPRPGAQGPGLLRRGFQIP